MKLLNVDVAVIGGGTAGLGAYRAANCLPQRGDDRRRALRHHLCARWLYAIQVVDRRCRSGASNRTRAGLWRAQPVKPASTDAK